MGVERLRFKDENGNFYEGHKTDYLKNVAHIKKGKQLSVKNMIEHGEYYVLNGGIEPSGFTNEWNTESDTISISEGGNSCGYVNLNKEKFWSGGHNYTLQEIQLSLNYLYSFLKYKQLRIMSLRVGSGLPNIQKKALEKLKIKIPDTKEQEKIGNFLSLFYRLIEKLETKVRLLKDLKKGYLQQMFPAKGDKIPKIRFAGFDENWKYSSLGQLSDIFDGTHQTPSYTKEGIMFLSVEDISSLNSNKYISEEAFTKEFKIFPQKNDILMTRIGSIGISNIVKSDIPKAYYVSLALLKNIKLTPLFLNELIQSENVKRELWRRTLHIAFPKKINKNEIGKVPLIYPEDDLEQEKIGKFFESLDSMIEKNEEELNAIEQLKKGYMQRLFA